MARRTPTDTPADTPTLHGHYDGPRGHQDEHRHNGGDRVHGHPDKQSLGRVIGAEEYVAPAMLEVIRAETERSTRVSALTEAPTSEIPKITAATELVKAAANGSRVGADRAFAELTRIVERAETERREAEVRKFEGHTTVELLSLVVEAIDQEANRRSVDPGLIRKLVALVENWASQRGVLEENGS